MSLLLRLAKTHISVLFFSVFPYLCATDLLKQTNRLQKASNLIANQNIKSNDNSTRRQRFFVQFLEHDKIPLVSDCLSISCRLSQIVVKNCVYHAYGYGYSYGFAAKFSPPFDF